MSVSANQRFKRANPCPVCGGYEQMPHGQGKRCYGFLSDDGEYAHCTREELSGEIEIKADSQTFAHKLRGGCRCGTQHSPEPPQSIVTNATLGVARYLYTDEQGAELFTVHRYEPKRFNQSRPDGHGGRVWNVAGVRKVPYRLSELQTAGADETVFICEGEKDCDRLSAHGLVATTNACGANKWPGEFAGYFENRNVAVLADNDDVGRQHAESVAASLRNSASSVKVIHLPGLPEKGDVSDWLNASHSIDELQKIVEETPEFGTADGEARGVSLLPEIDAGCLDLLRLMPAVWDALKRRNLPPRIFRRGGELVRVEQDEQHRPVFRDLTLARVRHELADSATFYKDTKTGPKIVLPPRHVCEDLLATPNPDMPAVTRVVESPTFAPTGELETELGYHPASRVYCALPPQVSIPPVPTQPSNEDVQEAKRWLLEELLGEFPFVSEADRAAALALGILPFVRELIPGPTPLHLIEAPSPGTGKGLLVDALLAPSCGSLVGSIPEAANDDEWRKRITAVLRDGFSVVHIDNVTRPLDSGALSMALTIQTWTDRVLGLSETTTLPVRCGWVATANNPVMTTEVARRTIRVRLDAMQDRPWSGRTFKHHELRSWARENRGRLIWAYLILAQSWIAAGRPEYDVQVLGGFEDWSRVVGRILAHVGVRNFLRNLDEFYEIADVETAAWRNFVEEWWEREGDRAVKAAALYQIAMKIEGLEFGGGKSERAELITFSKALAKQRDRVIGNRRVVKAGLAKRATLWKLVPLNPN